MKRLLTTTAMVCLGFAAQAAQPDIVAILLDDLGTGEIGPLGHASTTPRIDALARSGITFSDGYAFQECTVTRAAMLTMRQPQEYGLYHNPKDTAKTWGMPPGIQTFPRLLQQAGYQTSLVGKAHFGKRADQFPLSLGFDRFYGFTEGAHDYLSGELWDNRIKVPLNGYLTDVLANEAVRLLRSAGGPKAVVVTLNVPHKPLQAPPGSGCGEDQRCIWDAMMANADAAIGRIIDAARPNTLFVLSADNGCNSGVPCQSPQVSGKKHSLNEGGTRVPYIMSWPGVVAARQVSRKPVSVMDWGPTFLAAAGLPVPASADGINMRSQTHECLVWGRTTTETAIRCGQFKLLAGKVYNLKTDLRETRNVAAEQPGIFAGLKAKLALAKASWITPQN